MMPVQTIILSLALSFVSTTSMAGTGHDHSHRYNQPASQNLVEANATKSVAKLVDKGKLEKSWRSIKIIKSEKKKFGKDMEWVVSFNNKNILDPTKQTLYIFLTLDGKYHAAGYSDRQE